jgi:hypothetical protein
MAYWGGSMNYVGGATRDDRKEFLKSYDAWLEANGRLPRGRVYKKRDYVPKPQRFYTTGLKKGQPIVRKALTEEQKAARLAALEYARDEKARMAKAKKTAKAKKAAKTALSGILGSIKY